MLLFANRRPDVVRSAAAEQDHIEQSKVPEMQEDPAEVNALEDLLGQLDIAAGESQREEPIPAAQPRLTPQQAQHELQELEEFRSLGLVSPAEFEKKQAALVKAGAVPHSNGNTAAVDVVDALLAELE